MSSAGSGHKEARGVQVWGTRRENTRRNEEVVQMWDCLAAFQGCSGVSTQADVKFSWLGA